LAAEIKFLRSAKDCRYRIVNEDIWIVLEIFALNRRIEGNGKLWKERVKRMNEIRIARQTLTSQGVRPPTLEKTQAEMERYK
jgi:hypothetical protein